MHLVLVHPEIPGNTGNIARLCAATGAVLHLVEPLGFVLKDRYLRRAGLDYWPKMVLCVHPNWEAVTALFSPERLHLFTTKATHSYVETSYTGGDALVFGRESRGLDESLLKAYPERCIRIPMRPQARSLNLSNACAIAIYEARRQVGWTGDLD
ncbi:MAG: tRNA (cytidine(34)-2'-O)-methyltransferase [Myxococcota bacterium]